MQTVMAIPASDTRLNLAKRLKERCVRLNVQWSFQQKVLTIASSVARAEATTRGRCTRWKRTSKARLFTSTPVPPTTRNLLNLLRLACSRCTSRHTPPGSAEEQFVTGILQPCWLGPVKEGALPGACVMLLSS